ncbi:MAG: hypothetical protein R3Y07_05270 [Eubacteriales bacterium]
MATHTQITGKGRALRSVLETNPSQVQSWLSDLEKQINISSSLSKNTDVGIYLAQFKAFPKDAIRLDRLIDALDAAN